MHTCIYLVSTHLGGKERERTPPPIYSLHKCEGSVKVDATPVNLALITIQLGRGSPGQLDTLDKFLSYFLSIEFAKGCLQIDGMSPLQIANLESKLASSSSSIICCQAVHGIFQAIRNKQVDSHEAVHRAIRACLQHAFKV